MSGLEMWCKPLAAVSQQFKDALCGQVRRKGETESQLNVKEQQQDGCDMPR